MKYLETYAEPEAKSFERFVPEGVWNAVVVVPTLAEDERLPTCLDSLELAAQRSGGKALALIVVNARDEHTPEWHASNQATLDHLQTRDSGALTLSIVDRASPGLRFREKEGVGLARKIGCDIALALKRQERITGDLIHTTDADACVDGEYFLPPKADGAAFYHPHSHVLDHAPIALYDLFLRYYVEALRFAGSPYAFPTVGSTLAFRYDTYAAVRGFPRKLAGEDFYFLNKAAKVGPILPTRGLVTLSGRRSLRVPFGTGASVCRLDDSSTSLEEIPLFYHPRVFEWLGEWIRSLNTLSVDEHRLERATSGEFVAILKEMDAFERVKRAEAERPREDDRRRHLHEWFDAFRTLKLVHQTRDKCLPSVSYRNAALAEFVPKSTWRDNLMEFAAAWCDAGLGR